MKKLLKILTSSAFYLVTGILLSISFLAAYAAWNDQKISGDDLTAVMWMDIVHKLEDLGGECVTATEPFHQESSFVTLFLSGTATCPPNTSVTGGGCILKTQPESSPGYYSALIGESRPSGNGWRCSTPFRPANPDDLLDHSTVYARCCPR